MPFQKELLQENVGDVILCEPVGSYGTTVLRFSNVVPNTDMPVYQGVFDNNIENVFDVPADNVIGTAVSYNKTLGAVITFVTSYKGMTIMVVVPLLVLLVCELIISLVSKMKLKSEAKHKAEKNSRQSSVGSNSPLSPEKLGSHTAKPVTIEDFIFGKEDKQEKAVKSKPEKDVKSEKPKTEKPSRVKAERVKIASKTSAVKDRDKAEKAQKPQKEENTENTVEIPDVPEEVKAERVVSEGEKSSNESLDKLIKLMEEQEKILKTMTGKE